MNFNYNKIINSLSLENKEDLNENSIVNILKNKIGLESDCFKIKINPINKNISIKVDIADDSNLKIKINKNKKIDIKFNKRF